MTPTKNHMLSQAERQATIHELFQEKLRLNIRHTLISILEEEVNEFTQAAPYQRSPEHRDYRNGYYLRDLVTTAGEISDLPVPRTRQGFRTELFEHYQWRQAELDGAIPDMFVKGASMEQAGNVVETLTGGHPSPSTVSLVFHSLEDEFENWKSVHCGLITCTPLLDFVLNWLARQGDGWTLPARWFLYPLMLSFALYELRASTIFFHRRCLLYDSSSLSENLIWTVNRHHIRESECLGPLTVTVFLVCTILHLRFRFPIAGHKMPIFPMAGMLSNLFNKPPHTI